MLTYEGVERIQASLFPVKLELSFRVHDGLVISGEFLVSKAGLGYLIVYGGQVFQLDLVMASVVILAVVAAVMYEAVVLLEKIKLKSKNLSHKIADELNCDVAELNQEKLCKITSLDLVKENISLPHPKLDLIKE